MKIAIYAICKDELKNISDWLKNTADADEVVIVDTGSMDATPQVIEQEAGSNVAYYEALFDPFSFSAARNFALNKVSDDIDYAVYLDLDERLSDGWYNKLKAVINKNKDEFGKMPSMIMFEMIFSRDESGAPKHVYEQSRCHTPTDYHWKYSCHEVLVEKPESNPENLMHIITNEVQVEHFKDEEKPRDYLHLLAYDAQHIRDQRSMYYYARELYYNGNYRDAIEVSLQTLNIDGWQAQKAMVYALIASCYDELDEPNMALPNLYQAMLNNPNHPDHWFDLALHYYSNEQWYMCIGYLQRAIALANSSAEYVIKDVTKSGWQAHDMLGYAYFQIGDQPRYVNHCVIAYQLNPQNERLLTNFKDIQERYPMEVNNGKNKS